jgi:hypothetical protein
MHTDKKNTRLDQKLYSRPHDSPGLSTPPDHCGAVASKQLQMQQLRSGLDAFRDAPYQLWAPPHQCGSGGAADGRHPSPGQQHRVQQ